MQSDLIPIRVLGVLEVWTVVLMTSFRIRWVADEQKDRVVMDQNQLNCENVDNVVQDTNAEESVEKATKLRKKLVFHLKIN